MFKWTPLALVLGFIIDLLLGDPRWLYHPVRVIGLEISFLEKKLDVIFLLRRNDADRNNQRMKKRSGPPLFGRGPDRDCAARQTGLICETDGADAGRGRRDLQRERGGTPAERGAPPFRS